MIKLTLQQSPLSSMSCQSVVFDMIYFCSFAKKKCILSVRLIRKVRKYMYVRQLKRKKKKKLTQQFV